jgi:hypothetical protein
MTIQEQFVEVYRQFQESQRKYAYFLLTVAGAGIALAINSTQDAQISMSQVPVLIAVILWGLSFFCGCKYLNIQGELLRSNSVLLVIKCGDHPEIPATPQNVQLAEKAFGEHFEKRSNSGGAWGKYQLKLIFYGSLFYIEWHVLEMLNRSIAG